MKLTFLTQHKSNWGELQASLSKGLQECMSSGKDFEVEFKEIKQARSMSQNAGYWRLCTMLIPYFQKEYGQICDKDFVSDTAKLSASFSNKIGKQLVPRSLTTATKEDMNILIEKLYSICEHFGLKNYELTSAEMRALENYYK